MFEFKLNEDENVIAMHRKSEAALFKPVTIIFLAIYIPWYFLIKYDLVGTYKNWLLLWTLLVLCYAIYKYVLWLLNVYIITDKRIILVNYENLFQKIVTESPIAQMSNISFKTTGIFSSLFNFGEVEIQVTGLNRLMLLKQVKEPSEIKDALWQLKHNSVTNTKGVPVVNKIYVPTKNKLI